MDTLQGTALTRILENLPINDATSSIMDQYILKYLTQHSSLQNQIIESSALYNVFLRSWDDTCERHAQISVIQYLKSFGTESAAVEWILKHGADIITYSTDYYNSLLVMCIIYYKDVNCVDELPPSNLSNISAQRYPTFAFTSEAYQMLLEEHKKQFFDELLDPDLDLNPYWIRHITDDNVVVGCPLEHLKELHPEYPEHKDQSLQNFESLKKDTDAYISRMRAMTKSPFKRV